MCINALSVSALAETAVTERALKTLNSIRTLYAEFKQYDQDGNRWSGKMWLERPGKLRFEYDPPEKDVIWSTGLFVNLYDAELEAVTQIPTGLAPAWFLLEDPVELDKDVEILAEGSAGKTYFITAAQNSLLTDAKVTIIFELGAPDQILGWTVAEDGGKTMHVNLIDPVIGSPINEDIFQYQPPTPKYPNN